MSRTRGAGEGSRDSHSARGETEVKALEAAKSFCIFGQHARKESVDRLFRLTLSSVRFGRLPTGSEMHAMSLWDNEMLVTARTYTRRHHQRR
jgi:hypothetical protein